MQASVSGPVVLIDDKLYVPCVNGRLYTLNAGSGRLSQRGIEYQVEGSVSAAPPVVTDKLLFLGTSGSLIYTLDRVRGKCDGCIAAGLPSSRWTKTRLRDVYAAGGDER